MPNVTSNNFRTEEEVERDRESAQDWWESRYNDEWISDRPPIDLHPCPVVSDGLCSRGTCEGCKMPEALNKRNEDWEITEPENENGKQ